MQARHTHILTLVASHGRMEVATLSHCLGVSSVTIRKDLNLLAARGLIRREHGAAVLGSPDEMAAHMATRYETKLGIAQRAAESVQNGETVMIESGACCALLAEELASARQDITIVTNSAFIAGHIRHARGARVVLLGGEYQPQSQVMVGPMARLCASRYTVGKLFIGTDGFGRPEGFTGGNMLRAETVQAMAQQAAETIVLTGSEKFGQRGIVSLVPVDRVARVYTDARIPAEDAAWLRMQGVKVYTADT